MGTESRLTDEQIEAIDMRFPFHDQIGFARAVESAVRSQYEADLRQAREALQAARDHIEGSICYHENTHRGGAIWTICNDCDQKWADDRGGFKKPTMPAAFVKAGSALSALNARLGDSNQEKSDASK